MPTLDGVLETALYVDELDRALGFAMCACRSSTTWRQGTKDASSRADCSAGNNSLLCKTADPLQRNKAEQMAPPFKQMQPQEFVRAVSQFPWSPRKTLIHMHHTWRPNHSQYNGLSSIEGMYDYHVNTNGWSDIAQHISIAPDGTVWTGRPWNKSPASAVGFNSRKVFMFETIGDFDVGKDPLAGAQLDTVVLVIATLMDSFDLGDAALKFHNEMSIKTCPGSSVKKSDILDLVSEARQSAQPSGAPTLADTRQKELFSAMGAETPAHELEKIDEGDLPENDPAYERAIEYWLRK